MRREFEMTEDDLRELLDASKPVPAMYLTGGQPMFGSPQENAWKRLGEKLGFQPMTVRPVDGKGQRFFTAEASDGEP
jgi:argininosuccinate lyase